MPQIPVWLHRVPEIVAEVSALPVPVLDRAVVEQIFGLKRRQAIELMHRFGGYQVGRVFVLDRAALLISLAAVQSEPNFDRERRCKERISSKLEELRRQQAAARVRIPVAPEVFGRRMAGLPAEIELESGKLVIRFASSGELLQRLFELSQAITNDFDQFERLVAPVIMNHRAL